MIDVLVADITTLAVDAIVNAANGALRGGGGVDGAIHRAAGPGLMAELRAYDGCATGDAVLTGGHRLPARYVVHAVGPVWAGGARGEPELLAAAYRAAFRLAAARADVRTIAFPAISTGVYGYPKPQAAAIAAREMVAHEPRFDRIVAAVTDAATAALYAEALAAARTAADAGAPRPPA